MSCDLPGFVAQQFMPSPIPGAVGTIVARTVAAAATQTAALITPTLTPTITPLPTQMLSATPTPWPTLSPAFLFRLTPGTSTPNARGTPPTSAGAASSELSCKLLSQSVKNDTHFSPRDNFGMGWRIRNDGTAAWDPTDVYFAYLAGTKTYLEERTALPTIVTTGAAIALSVDMAAPRNSGTYTTVWSLRRGTEVFCHVSLRIIVP